MIVAAICQGICSPQSAGRGRFTTFAKEPTYPTSSHEHTGKVVSCFLNLSVRFGFELHPVSSWIELRLQYLEIGRPATCLCSSSNASAKFIRLERLQKVVKFVAGEEGV